MCSVANNLDSDRLAALESMIAGVTLGERSSDGFLTRIARRG
jgi:hypothetical protein